MHPQQDGQRFAALPGVHAMTDVTGFGLAGHLLEMCEGSRRQCPPGLPAALPLLDEVDYYLSEGCVPGGTSATSTPMVTSWRHG